jgi:hypothetical protein
MHQVARPACQRRVHGVGVLCLDKRSRRAMWSTTARVSGGVIWTASEKQTLRSCIGLFIADSQLSCVRLVGPFIFETKHRRSGPELQIRKGHLRLDMTGLSSPSGPGKRKATPKYRGLVALTKKNR